MHIQFTENGPYWPTENTKFTPSYTAFNDMHPEILIEYNGKQYWETLHQFKFAMIADAKKKANEIIREKIDEVGKVSPWISEWWKSEY